MKVFISADMEGVTGVSGLLHMKDGGYERMRKLLTEDINVAIDGAFEAGATEVLVADAHGDGTNILIEDLDDRAELISGSNNLLNQMVGLDETFDAVFFIGYHGGEGHGDGVLNHTIHSGVCTNITCNGKVAGELALNAGIAGHFDVPVVLVVGDDVACDEGRETLGDVETVAVKKSLDRYTARLLSPKRSHKLIKEGAIRSLKRVKEFKPYKVEAPVEIALTTKLTSQARIATLFPTIKRRDSKTVVMTSDNYLEAYMQLWGCLIIGGVATTEI
ncbi:MAG: M55 family metallopeptidase [Thermaerobacterales bacterium]